MQKAFTLAETLIVMGIIGVVAALTLPNLNSSTGDKEKVAKVKKIYQNLNDAFGRAQAIYGPVDEWCVNYKDSCRKRHANRISEFLKTSNICETISSCPLLDENGSGGGAYKEAVTLADGTILQFTGRLAGGGYYVGHASSPNDFCLKIDIDGINKGANAQGKDVFKFFYNKERGIYVDDWIMANESHYVDLSNDDYIIDMKATAWIINFGNMDYLKTSDGTTCPDGKTKLTSGGNHSCK